MATSHPNLALINAFFKAYADNDLEGINQVLDKLKVTTRVPV